MDLLKWHQNANGINVETSCDGVFAQFTIDNSLIHYLLGCTPRLFIVYVQNKQGNESQYVLDLTDIKPVINRSNGLKLTVGKPLKRNNVVTGDVCGRYCLARGESYHERFFTDKGWQSQRNYFNLFSNVSSVKVEEKVVEKTEPKPIVETPQKPKTPPTPPPFNFDNVDTKKNVEPEKPKGKLTVCKFCGEIYPSSMSICPYCQNKGKQQDNDVDISI